MMVQSFVSRETKRLWSGIDHRFRTMARISHLLPQYKHLDVTVVDTEKDVSKWIANNMPRKCHVGFDMEWQPSYTPGHENKVSVIQFATNDAAMIYQTHKFDRLPESLATSLQSDDIVKVGVGVYYDMMKLERDLGVPTGGFLDVGQALKRACNHTRSGLAFSFEHCFGFEVKKTRRVQMSNWAARELTPQQIQYAAHDALMGKLIHTHLIDKNILTEDFVEEAARRIVELMAIGHSRGLRKALSISIESSYLLNHLKRHFKEGENANGYIRMNGGPVLALQSYLSRVNYEAELYAIPESNPDKPRRYALMVGGRIAALYHDHHHNNEEITSAKKRIITAALASWLLHELIDSHRLVQHAEVDRLIRQYTGKGDFGRNPITALLDAKHRFYMSEESGEGLVEHMLPSMKPNTYFSYRHCDI